MSAQVQTYMGFAFVLILAFLILTKGDQVKAVLNSLGAANVGAIIAFQGGNPGGYVND